MKARTQKIREEIYQRLKIIAAKEGRSLQAVTEELLENALRSRVDGTNQETGGHGGKGGSTKDDPNGSSAG